MSILLRPAIGRDRELDELVAGAGGLDFGGCGEVADDADFGEGGARGGGAEGAEGGCQGQAAEGKHLGYWGAGAGRASIEL